MNVRATAALLFAALALFSCGKIGEPKPPYVRVPERVHDLAATQNGYDIVLSWTNPAHNVDGSNATDLATVHITNNGALLADVSATGAGKPQSYSIPAQLWIGQTHTFNVWLETERGKTSDVASVRNQPIDIPGAVTNVKAVVDQYAITIHWDAPAQNPSLANGYIVQRSDRQSGSPPITQTQYTDTSFTYGKTYSYQIASARQIDSKWISGSSSPPLSVAAVDHTAPHTPTGLAIVFTDAGAIVTWDVNPELDLKGYFVFRNGTKLNEGQPQPGNHFVDADYKPNTTYSVSAVDEYGNESPRSVPIS